ncbi:MAG TPA: alpha/beta hydrolase [Acidisarcina sp.]
MQPGTQDGVVVIKSLLMVQPAWVRDRYHFVVVLKRGVPFYGPQDYIPNEEYYNWSSLSNLTEDVNAVIAELSTKTWVDSSRIVVIGHSAGADVAAKVAATNSKVTHVVCLGAGGASQIYDSIVGIRKKVLTGDLTTSQGEDLIQKEYATFREIFADPDSTSKKWQGETYKEWHSFLAESTTENLLKAHVPVFVAVGTKDRQVPIESADISAVEFLRRGKSNLTFVDLPDAGHSMMAWQTEPNGKGRLIDFQERIVREALRWVDDPTKWHSPSDFYRAY